MSLLLMFADVGSLVQDTWFGKARVRVRQLGPPSEERNRQFDPPITHTSMARATAEGRADADEAGS
jgi:hypothetical protein